MEPLSESQEVLYIVSCASSSAPLVKDFIPAAQEAGWNVYCIATPQGRKFLDISALERLTGYPVRSEYKHPDEPDAFPRADALVVFPATFNTLNKWTLGISDTLAVGLLCEYMGLHVPIIAVPGVTTASGLDSHPAFLRSIEFLRSCGVGVLYEPERYPPKNEVPWNRILDELRQLVRRSKQEHPSEVGEGRKPSGV